MKKIVVVLALFMVGMSHVYAASEKTLKRFNEIQLNGTYDLVIEQGREYSIGISGDHSIDVVNTAVVGSTLNVNSVSALPDAEKIVLTVTTPKLYKLTINGASRVQLEKLNLPMLGLVLNGAGIVNAQGQVDDLSVVIAGSGNVTAGELKTESANVEISGAGNVSVHATEHLDVNISGVGNVDYKGQPVVKRVITGAGQVLSD